jgi:hypothetical protein
MPWKLFVDRRCWDQKEDEERSVLAKDAKGAKGFSMGGGEGQECPFAEGCQKTPATLFRG